MHHPSSISLARPPTDIMSREGGKKEDKKKKKAWRAYLSSTSVLALITHFGITFPCKVQRNTPNRGRKPLKECHAMLSRTTSKQSHESCPHLLPNMTTLIIIIIIIISLSTNAAMLIGDNQQTRAESCPRSVIAHHHSNYHHPHHHHPPLYLSSSS